jgi:hypothetical protein
MAKEKGGQWVLQVGSTFSQCIIAKSSMHVLKDGVQRQKKTKVGWDKDVCEGGINERCPPGTLHTQLERAQLICAQNLKEKM